MIIGGGNAGVSLAARLERYGVRDVAVIEPKDHHLYQPLFSHIAGGRAQAQEAVRSQESVMPQGVTWIRDGAVGVDTDTNTVSLASGSSVSYGQLVVCPGLQYDWDEVPGLAEAVHSLHGASHYEFELAPKAWTLLSGLTSGTAVFTMPAGPIKCGGASQKPMYLACDYWREQGVLDQIRVVMVQPYPTVFGVPEIDRELDRKIAEYGIELRTNSELVSVDPAGRNAVIRDIEGRCLVMAKNLVPSDVQLEITQIKSAIGGKQNQRDTLRSLGLKRIGQTVVRTADAVTVGMLNTVPHLVKVEEAK
ncbi:50S ribosomal protein L30 [Pseudarthrobacter oxydans]|uniref:50S ribosomal protein L30 n=1 Tax=Pseudarthrobacter oxydans TaxID=1671 RepID=UPI00286BAEDF|nr:50S ribosomal protein L30 [Pseudarthrobacter oxydans]